MNVDFGFLTLPAMLFALLFLGEVHSVEYGETCTTDFGEGKCVTLRRCPHLAHLQQVPQGSISEETYSVLRHLFCGKLVNRQLFCCPYEKEVTSTSTTSLTDNYGERCINPERKRGVCIMVKECPHFAHLIGKENIPKSTVDFLAKSYCGVFSNERLICCPSYRTVEPQATTPTTSIPTSSTVRYKGICWTPNAVRGKCIKVEHCPQFSEALITQPVSEAIQGALNESFCGMRGNHQLVCCPDNDTGIQTTTAESVIVTTENGLGCITTTGEIGNCVREMDCPRHHGGTLSNHTQTASKNKSSCGVIDGQRLICCPQASDHSNKENRCQTPSGKDGKCISLNECPALSSLLDPKHITKDTLEELHKSHCGPLGDNNTYCCPSSATDNEDVHDLKQHQNLYLLDQNICGKSPLLTAFEENIEIGKKAHLSTIPWMALISYASDQISSFRCLGSIINRHYILTAARCVTNLSRDNQPISVRLGEHNLEHALDCTDETCAPAPQNIRIKEIISHPEYIGSPSYLNDIAIIRLAREINFGTAAVQPVCLPIEESLQTKDYTNKRLLASGWFTSKDEFSPDLLQDVVEGVSHEVCAAAYENETVISVDSHMCVRNGRGDDCLGKGASPLVSFEEYLGRKAAVQQGIGLFGPDICYHTIQPVVYTRVGNFMKWILDNLKP